MRADVYLTPNTGTESALTAASAVAQAGHCQSQCQWQLRDCQCQDCHCQVAVSGTGTEAL